MNEVTQIRHADLDREVLPVARLCSTPAELEGGTALRFTEEVEELGPCREVVLQLGTDVYRLVSSEYDPAGLGVVVEVSVGHPLSQVSALLDALGLPSTAAVAVFNGSEWLLGSSATHHAA